MYAIIEVGAKQYSVKPDDIIRVEKQNLQKGEELVLDKVLLVAKDDQVVVGRPYVKDAKVQATVMKACKADKVVSYKYRRRKSRHWKKGHRQQLTELKITSIKA